MGVNINNTERLNSKGSNEPQQNSDRRSRALPFNAVMQLKLPVDIIKEKMKVWMQEGDYLWWYKSESA